MATITTSIWKLSQFLVLIQRSHSKLIGSSAELWATPNILLSVNLVTLTTNKKEEKNLIKNYYLLNSIQKYIFIL